MSRLHAHLDVGGIEHEVHAELLTDSSGAPITTVTLREPEHGGVIAEVTVEGHVDQDAVLVAARELAEGAAPRLPAELDRAEHRVTITHEGTRYAVYVRHTTNPHRIPVTVIGLRAGSEWEIHTLVGWLDDALVARHGHAIAGCIGIEDAVLASAEERHWIRFDLLGDCPSLTRTDSGDAEIVVTAGSSGRVADVQIDACVSNDERGEVGRMMSRRHPTRVGLPAGEVAAMLEETLAKILGRPVTARVVEPAPKRRWLRLAIRGGGSLPVQVTREEVAPTRDGLVEVRYDRPDRPEPEHMTLHVTAYVTAAEEAAIEATLRRMWVDGNGVLGPVIGLGGDRAMACHHDPLLPVEHDSNCALLQRDCLAGVVFVAVTSMFAANG